MTSYAVFDVANAFLQMLCPNAARFMLMTGEAGVCAEVIYDMAGRTRGLVRAAQREKAGVVESGWLPAVLTVTSAAVRRFVGMELICGRNVTTGTLIAHRGIQKPM